MGDRTKIEWSDATWNPVTGCDKVSSGCEHCYAETVAKRFAGTKAYPDGFKVTLWPDRLDQPERWTKPRRIFVNSMSDLFHADIPDDYVAQVWAVMSLAPQHTFQVLTKRPGRMRSLTSSFMFRIMVNAHRMARGYSVLPDSRKADGTYAWPLSNVWLGTSVEDQKWANVRVPVLLDTPAAVRFISAEPLLGPVVLPQVAALDWVIVGGESGPGSRPMHPGWAIALRDQCAGSHVPFLFKQWGDWAMPDFDIDPKPGDVFVHGNPEPRRVTEWHRPRDGEPPMRGAAPGRWDPYGDTLMRRVGKKVAGRLLSGEQWDGYPAAGL